MFARGVADGVAAWQVRDDGAAGGGSGVVGAERRKAEDTGALPSIGNLDFLDGVSFRKGCYVGQELTHRAHVMSVPKKRLLPVHLLGSERWPPEGPGATIFTAATGGGGGGAAAGRLLAFAGRFGVAAVRLPLFDADLTGPGAAARCRLGSSDGPVAEVAIPDWWPPPVED